MNGSISIIVADDHPLLRDGVIRTLQSREGIDVLGEADSADTAVDQVVTCRPDIALLDISMPGNGIDAARRIAAMQTNTRIVMFTVSEEDDDVIQAMKGGAHAYVLKGARADELVDVIRTVHLGGTYIPPYLASQILLSEGSRKKQPSTTDDLLNALTDRETEILKLVSIGNSNKEVGRVLDLQEKTVKHYMTSILQKLHAKNRVEAAVKAQSVWGTGAVR